MADIGIEVLRMAAIHTPTPMSTAMGLVAAIVIGQVAIDVGLFTPEVVLYVAVSAIFTFAIPSYELSITTKVFRIGILLSTAILGAPGFFMSIAVLFYYLCSLKTDGCSVFMAGCSILPTGNDAGPYQVSNDCGCPASIHYRCSRKGSYQNRTLQLLHCL